MSRHLILIGLPGAGKTTAGRAAAEALGAAFVDLDAVVEQAAGIDIPTIFRSLGEPHFRRLEREAMARSLAGPVAVIAAGGGWAAQPGAVEAARGTALVVYLEVSPTEAFQRLGPVPGRPLLAGAQDAAPLARLLAEREASYRLADAVVATDGRVPAEVVAEVVRLASRDTDL